MKITRRSFIKKTSFSAAAITVLGVGTGLAQGTSGTISGTIYEYALRCVSDPTSSGARNPLLGYFTGAEVTSWDNDDDAVRCGLVVSGPKKGNVFEGCSIGGYAHGHHSDDADDGTPVLDYHPTGGSPFDADPDDVKGHKSVSFRCSLALKDGPNGKVSWTPSTLGVKTASENELTVSALAYPTVGILAIAAVRAPGETTVLGIAGDVLGMAFDGELELDYPSTVRRADIHMNWSFEVVKRFAGSQNPWQYHSPAILDQPPTWAPTV